jgi:hypothetical protein
VSTRELLIVFGGLGLLIVVSYIFGVEYRSWESYVLLIPIILGMGVFSFFVLGEDDE